MVNITLLIQRSIVVPLSEKDVNLKQGILAILECRYKNVRWWMD